MKFPKLEKYNEKSGQWEPVAKVWWRPSQVAETRQIMRRLIDGTLVTPDGEEMRIRGSSLGRTF